MVFITLLIYKGRDYVTKYGSYSKQEEEMDYYRVIALIVIVAAINILLCKVRRRVHQQMLML